MSKIKLTKEQKEYLKSIESKKIRKKQKKSFKTANNFYKLSMYTIADGTDLREVKIIVDDPLLTPEKLREITQPKNFDSDLEKKFSLKDLRIAFLDSRLMKGRQKENQLDYEAVYYYEKFEDFFDNFIKDRDFNNSKKV